MTTETTTLPKVETHVLNIHELMEFMDEILAKSEDKFANKMNPAEFMERTMPLFGLVEGENFIIINNEYAEDNNPVEAYAQLFNRYYEDATIGYNVLMGSHKVVVGSVDHDDEDYELTGIDFPAEDD